VRDSVAASCEAGARKVLKGDGRVFDSVDVARAITKRARKVKGHDE
jgi:hypothetical protein